MAGPFQTRPSTFWMNASVFAQNMSLGRSTLEVKELPKNISMTQRRQRNRFLAIHLISCWLVAIKQNLDPSDYPDFDHIHGVRIVSCPPVPRGYNYYYLKYYFNIGEMDIASPPEMKARFLAPVASKPKGRCDVRNVECCYRSLDRS